MKTISVIVILLVSCTVCFSQSFIIRDLSTLSDRLSYKNNNNEDTYSQNIDGSPYLTKDFIQGEVILNDSFLYKYVPLRYNIYNDKIEFKNNKEQVLEIDNSKQNGKFKFDDHLFIYHKYQCEGQIKQGILEQLVDGKVQLYKKYIIKFEPATKAAGYQDAKPNRFIRFDDEYLIAIGEDIPEFINKNKKILFGKLNQFKPDIGQYAKKEKLNPKSEKDLIHLIEYCNE